MKKSFVTILVAGSLSAFLALAADQPPAGGSPGVNPGGGNPGGPGGGRGQRSMSQGRGGGGFMGLDEQQRQVFQEAMQKESQNLRSLEEKLRVAQKELVEATLASTYDEKVVQTKAEAVAKIQVEMMMLRAKALSAVAPSLKTEQKQMLVDSPMGAMLLNSGGPGGGAQFMGRGGFPGGPGMGPGGGRGRGPDGITAEGVEPRPRER